MLPPRLVPWMKKPSAAVNPSAVIVVKPPALPKMT